MESEVLYYKENKIDPLFIEGAIERLKNYLAGPNVLNIGVGYGTWDAFLNKLGNDFNIESLDISSDLINFFSEKFNRIQYITSDIFEFSPTKKYNTIVLSHFLEHMNHPVDLLKMIKSWLTHNGRIIIIVPNANSLHRRIGVEIGLLGKVNELNEADLRIGHKRVYDFDGFRQDLEASDLKINSIGAVTVKALANSQLESMSPEYVKACIHLKEVSPDWGAQLYAVLEN